MHASGRVQVGAYAYGQHVWMHACGWVRVGKCIWTGGCMHVDGCGWVHACIWMSAGGCMHMARCWWVHMDGRVHAYRGGCTHMDRWVHAYGQVGACLLHAYGWVSARLHAYGLRTGGLGVGGCIWMGGCMQVWMGAYEWVWVGACIWMGAGGCMHHAYGQVRVGACI